MLAPTQVPDWVPSAVREMAAVLPVGHAIAERLLTDARMKKVWRYLRRRDVSPVLDHLNSYERLSHWEIDGDFSAQDQGCAALFAFAVIEFSGSRNIWTRTQAAKWAEEFDSASQLCAWIKDDPMFEPEVRQAASVMAAALPKHGQLLKEQGRPVDLGQNDAPYILSRSSGERGDDEVRAKVRVLATATRRIYGSPLYRTVATIATVALPDHGIGEESVRNWCADLLR